MTLLERYLWRSIALGILITWLSLSLLDGFFDYMGELNDTQKGTGYGALEAAIFTLLTLPSRLYLYFPSATLIGALMGLGGLAANSELIAMRATGLSIARIIWMTIKMGLVLVVIAFSLGEWVAPQTELQAQNFKLQQLSQQVKVSREGLWIKEGNTLIQVEKMWTQDYLEGVHIYTIDPKQGQLVSIQHAKSARQQPDQHWELFDVSLQQFSENTIQKQHRQTIQLDKLIPSDLLSTASMQPAQLAASELVNVIEHNRRNNLDTARLELAFWTHFTVPLSALVMLVISAPFVFGSQRHGGTGQRIFLGILLGIVFFLLNRIMSNLGIVYGLPPLLSAALPLLLFLAIGLILLQRIR